MRREISGSATPGLKPTISAHLTDNGWVL